MTRLPSLPTTALAVILLCVATATRAEDRAATAGPSSETPVYGAGDIHTGVSRIFVFVDKTGLGHQHGVEAKLSACRLAIGAPSEAGQLVFDMTSFQADTASARKHVGLAGTTDAKTRAAVNSNMRGADVLDVQNFPTATFRVDSASATGRESRRGLPTYRLVGKFTLHGTTRPLAIVAEVERIRGWLHARGVFTLKQSSYGIRPFSKAFGAIGVADELKVYGDLYIAPTEHVALTDVPSRP